MQQEIVIATNNRGKLAEIKNLIPGLSLLTLADIGFTEDIEEPYDSFEQNAHIKAYTVYRHCGKNVLADDSGICVHALHGAPGVHSARYAGEPKDDVRNLEKLLSDLSGVTDRSAFYKAVICLYWNNEPYFFEGICEGHIALYPQGDGGFGYDPVFVPDGFDRTFGELSPAIKGQISHRAKAIERLNRFIRERMSA